jgi:adenosylcobalamin-dependent ribonucleoside-triphosphate reductase
MFQLKEDFINHYRGKQPKWGPIGYITYLRTYSRTNDGVREEFWQTLKRVTEGVYTTQKKHCEGLNLPWNSAKAQKSAQEMYKYMFEFKFLPPGRGLWMMGTKYVEERGGAALANCGFASTKDLATDFSGPFTFLMDMSMLGVGVGGDTKGKGTVTIKKPKIGNYVYVVADTREGWVDLIDTILNAYIGKGSVPQSIDYSKIRSEGSLIKGFGGVSSGPGPLKELAEIDIPNVLNSLEGEKITSTAIVDLFNVIGRCVVSGNVRRTAEILFGDISDQDFINLKNPDNFPIELSHHRWASNNSIFAELGMDYNYSGTLTAKNGEPGYIWLENIRNYGRMKDGRIENIDGKAMGTNPCVEQSLEDRELCNVVEVFPSNCENFEEYMQALKYAYLYAKTVTLIPTHNPRTNAVMLRNRRIGTSQSGIVKAFEMRGKREHLRWCDEGYKRIRDLDQIYSDWLCVPESIKVTSVKPSGTVSLLPGVASGIHYPYASYYVKNMRIESNSPLIEPLRKAGYPIEPNKTSKTSVVVSFPVKGLDQCSRSIEEVSMWEQLENAAQMQHYWADNQVSATITFKADEAKDIPKALELYETRLKGISFLPYFNGYDQAPLTPITEQEYETMIKNIKEIKINTEVETHDYGDVAYCDGDQCTLADPKKS